MIKDMKEPQQKSNKIIVLGLVGIIAFVAIISGFLYAKSRSEKDVLVIPKQKMSEKSKDQAPKVVISLIDESIEAQRQIDNILLAKDNWQLVEDERVEKLKKVEDSAARVRISERELNVGIPSSSSVRGAAEWLSNKLQNKGIFVISKEFVRYREDIGYELQIGIKVKAGNGSRYFVTDKVVFLYNDNLTIKDKDIKDYPDEEPKKKTKKAIKNEDEIVPSKALEPKVFANTANSQAASSTRTVNNSTFDDEDEDEEEVDKESSGKVVKDVEDEDDDEDEDEEEDE